MFNSFGIYIYTVCVPAKLFHTEVENEDERDQKIEEIRRLDRSRKKKEDYEGIEVAGRRKVMG